MVLKGNDITLSNTNDAVVRAAEGLTNLGIQVIPSDPNNPNGPNKNISFREVMVDSVGRELIITTPYFTFTVSKDGISAAMVAISRSIRKLVLGRMIESIEYSIDNPSAFAKNMGLGSPVFLNSGESTPLKGSLLQQLIREYIPQEYQLVTLRTSQKGNYFFFKSEVIKDRENPILRKLKEYQEALKSESTQKPGEDDILEAPFSKEVVIPIMRDGAYKVVFNIRGKGINNFSWDETGGWYLRCLAIKFRERTRVT